MSSFHRRIGAAGDVKELEYIAALHQTCAPALRKNGTISSIDILRFIKSRTNLNVSPQDTIRIVRGLGGGVVGEDVIRQILQEEQAVTPSVIEKKEKKKMKMHMKVASTLSVLRKKHAKDAIEEEEEEIPQGPFSMEGQKGKDGHHHGGWFHRHNKKHDDDSEDNNGQQEHEEEEDVEDPQQHDDVDKEDIEQEEFLDLVQIAGILLTPTLARAGQEWRDARTPQPHVEEPPPPAYHGIKGFVQKQIDKRIKKEQQAEKELHKSLDPKPPTIISDVLTTMLKSVDYSNNKQQYPPLNAALVKQLLITSGEYERAADAVLVDKMVEAASPHHHSAVLDEEAFVQALTGDLSLWKVGCEDRNTTSFYDVYGFESYREQRIVQEQQEQAALEAAKSVKEEQSRHRLSKAGLSVDGAGSEHVVLSKDGSSSDEGDDASVEDDIVPTIVGYSPRNITSRASTDMSVSGVSVITMEELDDTKQAKELNDDGGGSSYKLDRTRTPLDIDFAIDMHSSIVLTVLIFFFFMCTSLVYAVLILQMPELTPNCGKDDFGCTLGAKVVTWMLFACILAGTGYLVIIPLSLGNQPTERSPRRLLLSLILCLIITWIPFAAIEAYDRNLEPPYSSGPAATVNEPNYDASQWVTRFIGTLTCLVMLWRFVLACVGNERVRESVFMSKYFTTSAVRGSAREKKAATRKLNQMLENAHTLNPTSASKEETMMNFVLRGESFEKVGGLFWTWKRLFTRKLFVEDGVWIMSRLIIIQVIQFFLIVFYAYSGVLIVQEVARQAQEFQDTLQPGYPDWVYTFVPTPQQAQSALYPAVGVAVFVMITIFLIYLPSYVRTIFQFRCGIRPSLRSSEFLKYRVAVDAVYTNIGNAVFAMLGSSFLFFFLIGLVLFLFIWPFSRDFMILLVAWGLGLCITIVIKMVLVKNCRKRFYAGFYRTNPNGANLATLALECWFIGMGGGVLVGRFTQFILAACFFVGRTDVSFLSRDVALFGYAFDYVPTNFCKDILVHEAHRHPYFERLLAMYLMKLKNDKFSTEAGACWRQLFVTTLMPWMIKLRVFSDKRLEDSLDQYNARRLDRMSISSQQPSSLLSPERHADENKSPRFSQSLLSPKSPRFSQSLLDEVVEIDEEEEPLQA